MIVNVLCALLGFLLVAVGLWLMWPPMALLWVGAALLVLGFVREVPDGAVE